LKEIRRIDAKDPILDQLTLSLIYCNRTIAREAAETFYQFNVFRFAGDEIWDPLYRFFSTIGEENRGHLRSLIAEIYKGWEVWQDRYGVQSLTTTGIMPTKRCRTTA